ncbi:MAG TPA: BamA/TamA family outer membrane protein [Anaeromyxobacteraceae bacterium]|nr:BamA/TamA family outer membrane protein [Anaeromyxobacteraceae bacterium]
MPATALALPALALLLALAGEETNPAEPPSARRYLIERVELVGLRRTQPSEVRRHLAVSEGDPLDDSAVRLSRLRLLQLGWFSRVESRVERGSQRGLVILVFSFTERNTLIVSDFVLGSTGPQPIYGGFGLTEGNFLGLGLGLSGAFVYGGTPSEEPLAPARFALKGAFYDPEFNWGRLAMVAGVSAILLHGEEFACTDPSCHLFQGHYDRAPRLRYGRVGGELTIGIRPGPFERLVAGLRLERLNATSLPSQGGIGQGPSPSIHLGHSLITALTASYDRDTRDDLFLPSSGTRLAVNIVFGSQELGGDYEYSRYLVQVESDHGLPWGDTLRLIGTAGAVQGDAPFFERFYPADFAYFSIGPALGRALELNFSTDNRYDAYLAMGGVEYLWPLWSAGRFFHRGYLAFGARALYSNARPGAGRTPASSTPFSGDVALRLDTPVGSFNLSAGYALDNFL